MMTGICNDVNVYSASAIGFLGGIIYLISTEVLKNYKIDDPVEAVQIHGICGFFGILNVGIFGESNGFIYTKSFR